MRFVKDGNRYTLRLEQGENVIESLEKFSKNENLPSFWFFGLGAVSDPKIAYYSLSTKYQYKSFRGSYEVASLIGNLAILNGKPSVHAHVVLGTPEMESISGHLSAADVSVTLELLVFPAKAMNRKPDSGFGLNFLDL